MTGGNVIQICAAACRFPEADSPAALWDNVLAGRRAFRNVPPERLRLADYAADVIGDADSITPIKAALLRDYEFDREKFRVPQPVYDATDLAHWLALDVAADTLDGVGGAEKLDRERTAVIVGNTLTGEFSRSAALRGRLPFVDELVRQAAAKAGLQAAETNNLSRTFRKIFADRFPKPTEDSLAGGLANTIAGRITNHFDLKGGAYTVDGACASSLLAVCNACDLIVAGRADFVLVGAVDLSIDPFELVGFSRNGALARRDMRVFDAEASGFWPGEGCGFVLLAGPSAAANRRLPEMGTVIGWGQSTDGNGGLTRPDRAGQAMAIRRALDMAGIIPADVGYVEAHGTGTAVGDPTEIHALSDAYGVRTAPLAIGSVKANIGHTKAAAGMAGLIKALASVQTRTIPPHVGCQRPHAAFHESGDLVYAPADARPWPTPGPARAGVSAFGFGGVNTHVILEAAPPVAAVAKNSGVAGQHRRQDGEVFVFAAPDRAGLAAQVADVLPLAGRLSLAEMTDLAAALWRRAKAAPAPFRAALVAAEPDDLAAGLAYLHAALDGDQALFDPGAGIFFGLGDSPPRVGFLFPGQAAPSRPNGGAWRDRFDEAAEIVRGLADVAAGDPVATEHAQPAITGAALAAMRLLRRLGVEARAAVGHSVGELSALAWAGALCEADLIALAARRGRIMAAQGRAAGGAMVRVPLPATQAAAAGAAFGLQIACENAPDETVLSGPLAGVDGLIRSAPGGARSIRLPVSHAFHSDMMASAREPFGEALAEFSLSAPVGAVCSTVTGAWIVPQTDLPRLLVDQLTAPVRFAGALAALRDRVDLLVEVGPGEGLSRLAAHQGFKAISINAFADNLRGLLKVAAALYAAGADVSLDILFDNRPIRPFLFKAPLMLANICGSAPDGAAPVSDSVPGPAAHPSDDKTVADIASATDVEAEVHRVIADLTGLDRCSITNDLRFLGDLKLTSIRVGELVSTMCRSIGVETVGTPSDLATSSVGDLITLLRNLREDGGNGSDGLLPPDGIDAWTARFNIVWKKGEVPYGFASARRDIRIGGTVDARPDLDGILGRSEPEAEHLVLCLPQRWKDSDLPDLLARCQSAASDPKVRYLTVLHRNAPVGGFVRSVFLEGHFQGVRLIGLPTDPRRVLSNLEKDLSCARAGFLEYRFDRGGGRRFPFIVPRRTRGPAGTSLGPDDVILVTGGSRGIGLECALRWAEDSGAKLILSGRVPADDARISELLRRCRDLTVEATYVQMDVTDDGAVGQAIRSAVARLGPVTAVLHAAGVNEPKLLTALSLADLRATIGPKVTGLRNVMMALDRSLLKAVIAFGSLIRATGLDGDAHYALANELLGRDMAAWARRLPGAAVKTIEWSLWNGIGQGDAPTVERLRRRGVEPLPAHQALDAFAGIVRDSGRETSVIVSGRFGPPPTLRLASLDLPMLRFIDDVRVHYPGIEIVIETSINPGRDPYLAEHVIGGTPVFPGVMALEAMAQAAQCLAGPNGRLCGFDDVAFLRPVLVYGQVGTTLRIAALAQGDGTVDVTISEAASDAGPAVRATCRFGDADGPLETIRITRNGVTLAKDLYDSLYFNRGRFQRISRFHHIGARGIAAELRKPQTARWFSDFAPARLLLGDPAARDAMLHSLQACVPNARVLPTQVRRIRFIRPGRAEAIQSFEGTERETFGRSFVFDIAARNHAGEVTESWEGARFTTIAGEIIDTSGLPLSLLPAMIERRAGDMLARADLHAGVSNGQACNRDERRILALRMAGIGADVEHRGDGQPTLSAAAGLLRVSVAHAGDLTCAVTSTGPVGCDIEWLPDDDRAGAPPIDRRDAAFVSRLADRAGTSETRAGLLVWALREALKKAGCTTQPPLTLSEVAVDQWVAVETGAYRAAGGYWQDRLAVAVATNARAAKARQEGG